MRPEYAWVISAGLASGVDEEHVRASTRYVPSLCQRIVTQRHRSERGRAGDGSVVHQIETDTHNNTHTHFHILTYPTVRLSCHVSPCLVSCVVGSLSSTLLSLPPVIRNLPVQPYDTETRALSDPARSTQAQPLTSSAQRTRWLRHASNNRPHTRICCPQTASRASGIRVGGHSGKGARRYTG